MRARVVFSAMVLCSLVAASCGGDAGGGASSATPKPETAGTKACDAVGNLAGDPDKAMPGDVPVVAGAHVYQSQGPFGKTTQYFAAVNGDAEKIVATRDAAVEKLVSAGYRKLSEDQEEGIEAEAHLS